MVLLLDMGPSNERVRRRGGGGWVLRVGSWENRGGKGINLLG